MRWLLAFLLLLSLSGRASGAPGELKVGVAGAPPFVVDAGGGTLTGLSVEIWRSVAKELGLRYRLIGYDRMDEALRAVEAHEIDVLVGPVEITSERALSMSFTMPWFRSTLGIASSTRTGGVLERIRPFLSKAFLIGLGALLLALVTVGTLLWLVEHRAEGTQFPRHMLLGVSEGMWLALTTMSTVGYGDRYPVTVAGRVICGAWMLISMVTTAFVTAGMATAFTVAQMNAAPVTSAEAMAGRRVAVVRGSTAAEFALAHRARAQLVDHIQQALLLVKEGDVEATVYDRPTLQYWVLQHPNAGVVVAASGYEPQDYGFALPLRSSLPHSLNVALLKLTEEGEMGHLQTRWLGP